MSGKRPGKNDPSEKHAQALRDLQVVKLTQPQEGMNHCRNMKVNFLL